MRNEKGRVSIRKTCEHHQDIIINIYIYLFICYCKLHWYGSQGPSQFQWFKKLLFMMLILSYVCNRIMVMLFLAWKLVCNSFITFFLMMCTLVLMYNAKCDGKVIVFFGLWWRKNIMIWNIIHIIISSASLLLCDNSKHDCSNISWNFISQFGSKGLQIQYWDALFFLFIFLWYCFW